MEACKLRTRSSLFLLSSQAFCYCVHFSSTSCCFKRLSSLATTTPSGTTYDFYSTYTLYFISLQIVISHSDSISVIKYTRVTPIEFEMCPAGSELIRFGTAAYFKLCIRTLRGRSLRHPSFVAVVHHSFAEINLYRSLRTTQYQTYLRAKLSKRCCIMCLLPRFCTQE